MQNWSNPPEIRQKLGVRQKYFLPARRLSNPPEFCKSGGENRHLATLLSCQAGSGRLQFPKERAAANSKQKIHFRVDIIVKSQIISRKDRMLGKKKKAQ
jgi:hypothetical protein